MVAILLNNQKTKITYRPKYVDQVHFRIFQRGKYNSMKMNFELSNDMYNMGPYNWDLSDYTVTSMDCILDKETN